jgi:GT2 family glycosyltransferase
VKTSVIILCQPAETGVTALTLRHLVRDADQTTTIQVLVNGGFAGALRSLAPTSSLISYHSSPRNLGVAGGRNFLLRQPEVQSSDVIVILDNDVITPPGHIERLVQTLCADPDAGVIGPAVLRLSAVASALALDTVASLDDEIHNERLAGLRDRLRDEVSWFHLGTHPDWRAVYIDELQVEAQLAARAGEDVEPFYSMNHEDPVVRAAIAMSSTTPIPVSNVAGCCQAFRRELLTDVGLLMDEFSPYGYEDVEFCIRAASIGRRNYVDPSIFMLHGTDQRHLDRRSPAGNVATQRNFMRCKALLAWRHAHASWQASVERCIIRRYVNFRQALGPGIAASYLRAHVAGYVDAQRQVRHSRAPHSNPRAA